MPPDRPFPLPRALRTGSMIAAAAMSLGLLGGCGDLNDAEQGTTRNDLVTDLATELSRSTALTYSATYRVTGGTTATVVQAQEPARSALLFPDGKVTVTEDATTECRTAPKKALTCTMNPPPGPTTRPAAVLFADASRRGMVDPTTVLNKLNEASLNADVTVTQHGSTIAGRYATCVDVGDATDAAESRFQTCITNDGVLGSFTGLLDGNRIDVAMTQYESTADGTVFDPPPTATVIDRRR